MNIRQKQDGIIFSVLRTLHPVLHRGGASLHSRMGGLEEQAHYSGNWQTERESEACILPFLKKLSLRAAKQLRREVSLYRLFHTVNGEGAP